MHEGRTSMKDADPSIGFHTKHFLLPRLTTDGTPSIAPRMKQSTRALVAYVLALLATAAAGVSTGTSPANVATSLADLPAEAVARITAHLPPRDIAALHGANSYWRTADLSDPMAQRTRRDLLAMKAVREKWYRAAKRLLRNGIHHDVERFRRFMSRAIGGLTDVEVNRLAVRCIGLQFDEGFRVLVETSGGRVWPRIHEMHASRELYHRDGRAFRRRLSLAASPYPFLQLMSGPVLTAEQLLEEPMIDYVDQEQPSLAETVALVLSVLSRPPPSLSVQVALSRSRAAPPPRITIRDLLVAGVDVNDYTATELRSCTYLHRIAHSQPMASERNVPIFLEVAEALIEYGVDVNAVCGGWTPLHESISAHNLPLARLLLATPGIDLTLTNEIGQAPLQWAVGLRDRGISAAILAQRATSADVRFVAEELRSFSGGQFGPWLHAFVSEGACAALGRILEAYGDVTEAIDMPGYKDNLTSLALSVVQGRMECLRVLVEHGADLERESWPIHSELPIPVAAYIEWPLEQGLRAIDIARLMGRTEFVRELDHASIRQSSRRGSVSEEKKLDDLDESDLHEDKRVSGGCGASRVCRMM